VLTVLELAVDWARITAARTLASATGESATVAGGAASPPESWLAAA
jgi:hypothetical protein